MTLPITDSMLRSELRQSALAEIKNEQEISKLWGNLHKWETTGDSSLRGIEYALIDAVEKSGLVMVSDVYNKERSIRQEAETARTAEILPDNPDFTRVGEPLSLEGVFTPYRPLTPTDRFRHLLLRLECRRTMKCLKELVMAMHDDGFIRTEIIRLFATIKQLCCDTDEDFIRQGLTQFYFEIYHTFRRVLEKGKNTNYETDFQNFVYEWDHQFPNDDTTKRYDEKVAVFKPVIVSEQEPAPSSATQQQSGQPQQIKKPKAKDKFETFLEAAEKCNFSFLPKVKDLGSPEKIQKLVRCMLQDMGSVTDTYAHAAAMLEFLEFRKWYSDNYMSWSINKYDQWCSIYVMGNASGSAFKHYRQSLSADPSKDHYKYGGWKYKDIVEKEYNNILHE